MKNKIGYAVAVALLSAPSILAVGCAKTEKVDIGDGHDKAAVTGASLSDYAGNWDGYVEAYTFDDKSDRIRLKLNGSGKGTLEFGDSPTLPDPDPNIGYPPSINDSTQDGKPFMEPRSSVYPGFGYPVYGAKVESKRIRVGMATQDVFREWCEMQQPSLEVGAVPTRYSCADGLGSGGDSATCTTTGPDGTPIPIDCGKGIVCLTACQCTETMCSVSDDLDTQFDAMLSGDGDELTGTLVLAGERIIVHMTRM